ncbi:MAG: hypothetical protein KKB25_01105, partial [Nanoarchaeota archaeon]|nr:hypothetical protein [Nanoarchaeota archaeon]
MVDFKRNRSLRHTFKRKSLSEKLTEELKKPIYLNNNLTDTVEMMELASRHIHNHNAYLNATLEMRAKMQEDGLI